MNDPSIIDLLRQILARTIRMETRLVRMMDHNGLDVDGNPRAQPPVTEQKGNSHDQHPAHQ